MDIVPVDSSNNKSDDDLLREVLCKVSHRVGVEAGYLQKYGITSQEYWRLYHEQKGVCAVCGQPETVKRGNTTRMLCVDHNHQTGKVRGLLCSSCNTALGMLKEDTERMLSLIAYTEKWRGTSRKPRRNKMTKIKAMINAGQMTLFAENNP